VNSIAAATNGCSYKSRTPLPLTWQR